VEIKRIETGDLKASIEDGRLKAQIKKMHDYKKIPWEVVTIGDESTLKPSIQDAIDTLSAEVRCLGGSFRNFRTELKFTRYVCKIAKFMDGSDKINFPVFVNPVAKTDTILVRMLKQFPDIGDETSEMCSEFPNFPALFSLSTDTTEHEIATELLGDIEKLAIDVSNYIRNKKGTKPSKKPLEVFLELAKWHYGVKTNE